MIHDTLFYCKMPHIYVHIYKHVNQMIVIDTSDIKAMWHHRLSHIWSISSLILFIFPHVIWEFWVMILGKKERNSHNLINKRWNLKNYNQAQGDMGFFGVIRVMIWQKPCNTILISSLCWMVIWPQVINWYQTITP